MGVVIGRILPWILQGLPAAIISVEALFAHKAKSGPDKMKAVIDLISSATSLAEGIDPTDKATMEDYKFLVTSMTNDLVAFFNKHGWPKKLGG